MVRLLLALLYLICWVPLWILGVIAVPIAIYYGITQVSRINGQTIFNAPRMLWLWGNDEDGYDSDAVKKILPEFKSQWLRMLWWGAIRNPVNNLRFIKCLHPPQRADKIQWKHYGSFTLVWQGVFSRLIWNESNQKSGASPYFTFGWKYDPERRDATGWKVYGQGFGIRFKR